MVINGPFPLRGFSLRLPSDVRERASIDALTTASESLPSPRKTVSVGYSDFPLTVAWVTPSEGSGTELAWSPKFGATSGVFREMSHTGTGLGFPFIGTLSKNENTTSGM